MGATATSGTEATPASASTDTGGSTVRKVAALIEHVNSLLPLSARPSDSGRHSDLQETRHDA